MGDSVAYRRYATECLELASTMNDPQARAILLQMALVWSRSAARALGLQVVVLNARSERDFDQAFATLVQHRADALFVAGDPFFLIRRDQLAVLAARHAIPQSTISANTLA
jgi:DNA-binding LacI/PurR family transcriptional regulator